MKRHESLIKLSQDHHDGLIAAQLLKRGAADYKGMPSDFKGKSEYIVEFYNKHLIPHFKNEEEKLFPAVENDDVQIKKLIKELVLEHKQITDYIKSIEKNNHTEETLNKLGTLLDKHIRKEERELFELIQNKLNETELENIKIILSK